MSAAVRIFLVEIDHIAESASPGGPVTETIRLATKEFFDDAAGVVYAEAINSLPQYSRGLQGDRLGDYRSTIGTVEIDNADGEFDYLLGLALDGSEVRVYIGDLSWLRIDFQLAFTALATKAVAPSQDRISIQLKDTTSFLNKSIVGTPVGGTGPNADSPKPVNFGYVHQIEAKVLDGSTLTYVHSDPDTIGSATFVRDNGLDVNFVDNGDGTFTLDQSPVNTQGGITADVLAVATGSPADITERRISHAFRYFIGDRAGVAAAGLYLGPSKTFTPNDDDDYFVGISISDSKNVIDLLGELADSGNCYWAITREGKFTFGRLNPNDLVDDGSPSSIVEIEFDDIDVKTIKIDHTSPKYYKLQATMNRNWSSQATFATSMTPDERAVFTRKGLYQIQPDSVGVSYAESPELYSLSLTESPVLDTLLSGDNDETDVDDLQRWMERRRTMFLPWIEVFSFTVNLEFFELEIGDVIRLTMPRYGLDAGVLFQVVAVDLQLSKQKVALQVMRRRASEFVPIGFERDTIDDTRLITGIKVPDLPPIKLPPEPPITINPLPPILTGVGGGTSINVLYPPSPTPDVCIVTVPRSFSHTTFSVPFLTTDGTPAYRVSVTSDGLYAAVGAPGYDDGSFGNIGSGGVYIYKKVSGVWTQVALLSDLLNSSIPFFGWSCGISDNKTIVVSGFDSSSFAVFEEDPITPDTWPIIQRFSNSNGDLTRNVSIDNTGRAVITHSQFFNVHTWKRQPPWTEMQILTPIVTHPLGVNVGYLSARMGRNTRLSSPWVVVLTFEDDNFSPPHFGFEVWTSNDLITWSPRQTIEIPGAQVNTGGAAEGSISFTPDSNAAVLAIGAPGFNNGTGGAIYVYEGSWGHGYTQRCVVIDSGTGSTASGTVGISTAIGHSGNFLAFGTYGNNYPTTSNGRVWYLENLLSKTGTIDRVTDMDFTEIVNPYSEEFAAFGHSLVTNKCGHDLIVASAEFFGSPSGHFVDFYYAP